MTTTLTPAPFASVNGTHLQGYMDISYQRLVDTFGQPQIDDGDDKVRAEWILQSADGEVVTIYDWKDYHVNVEEVRDWHIGGHSRKAVDLVRGEGLPARAAF